MEDKPKNWLRCLLSTKRRPVLSLQPSALRGRSSALRAGGFVSIALDLFATEGGGRSTVTNKEGFDTYRQLSQALQTRLRWSCIGRWPASEGRGWSSTRFFFVWWVMDKDTTESFWAITI